MKWFCWFHGKSEGLWRESKNIVCCAYSTYHCFHCCYCCCWVASVVSDSVQSHRRQPTRLRRPWDSPGKNAGVGCLFLLQCMKVKSESEVDQSCLTLRDPMDCSLPGSSVHGIFQTRVVEWVAIAFSTVFIGTFKKKLRWSLLPLHKCRMILSKMWYPHMKKWWCLFNCPCKLTHIVHLIRVYVLCVFQFVVLSGNVWIQMTFTESFPDGSVVKNLPANVGTTGDAGLSPGSRRSPGEGNSNPFQYSCNDNPMDRGD